MERDSQSFILYKKIAQERTTKVYRARDELDGSIVAIKIPQEGCFQTTAEVELTTFPPHPALLRLKGWCETSNGPALVFPYMAGGDLLGLKGVVSEDDARHIFYNIFQALAHFHAHDVAHMDVKPENILLGDSASPETAVLGDLGFSVRTTNGICPDSAVCGTPVYSAPEAITRGRLTNKVDVWAAGVTMFVAMTKTFPLSSLQIEDVKREIVTGLPIMNTGRAFNQISFEGREFIRSLLKISPRQRPTAQEALDDPWFDPVRPTTSNRSAEDVHVGLDMEFQEGV